MKNYAMRGCRNGFLLLVLAIIISTMPNAFVDAHSMRTSLKGASGQWQDIPFTLPIQSDDIDPKFPVLWKNLNLTENGFLYDIAIDSANPANIYVGTDNPSNPVVYSNDFGGSWIIQTVGLPPSSNGQRLAVDPISPNYVYVGLRVSEGIYRSDDGGQNWVAKNNGLTPMPTEILSLIVHPITPTLIMAGSASGIPYIYRSENRGDSWTAIHLQDLITDRSHKFWLTPMSHQRFMPWSRVRAFSLAQMQG